MTKELEALEDIILYLNANEPKGLYCKNIEIIKTALKRSEESERNAETWKEVAEHKKKEYNIIHEECVRLTEIKNKQDEILRIIKKYPFVVFHIIKGTTYYELQHEMPNTELPSETKYDLLKESWKCCESNFN